MAPLGLRALLAHAALLCGRAAAGPSLGNIVRSVVRDSGPKAARLADRAVKAVAAELGPQQAAEEAPVLEPGRPQFVSDLPRGGRRCFALLLPPARADDFGGRARVVASVVALAGSPSLSGGWLPGATDAAPTTAIHTGFQTLDLELERKSTRYFLCVSTLSAQGCDAMLTVVVAEPGKEDLSPVRLRLNYPSIWTLGDGSDDAPPRSLRFVVEVDDLEDLRASTVPVSGQLDVALHVQELEALAVAPADEMCIGEPAKFLLGRRLPDVFDLLHTQLRSSTLGGNRRIICLRVTAAGQDGAVASVTIGPRLPGPYLAAAVTAGGRLSPPAGLVAAPICELVRLLVNPGTDTTITAAAEDGGPLSLSAALSSELLSAPVANRWAGEAPPGGSGAALVVLGADVAKAAAEIGAQAGGESSLSVSVCRTLRSKLSLGAAGTHFWITAVTDSDVVTLQDGRPFAVSLRSSAGAPAAGAAAGGGGAAAGVQTALWRDFRFFVPGGAVRPHEVTVSATSFGRLRLVGDTRRHPGRPEAYRWRALGSNTSHAVLRLTTEEALASDEVRLIDCRPPCYVYVSASSALAGGGANGSAARDSDLVIQMQSDAVAVKRLLEAQEQEETLAAGESQIFRYRLPQNGWQGVLVTLSVLQGDASFQISSSADFPADANRTTPPAHAAVLLEPFAGVMKAAVEAAAQRNASAAVFVRVAAGRRAASSFSIVASVAGAAKQLWSGKEARGAVAAWGYDRYKLLLGEAETRQKQRVAIDIFPLRGAAAVFVSCSPNEYPRAAAFDWQGGKGEKASIMFDTDEAAFRPGWVYIGVVGTREPAAYALRARWSSADAVADTPGAAAAGASGGDWTSVPLQDGMEELGHVAFDAARHYSFAAESSNRPVLLRAEAFQGAIGVCVQGPDTSALSVSLQGAEECRGLYSVADAGDAATGGLAAFDFPAASVKSEVKLWVRGLSNTTNGFVLRALSSSAVTTVVEEHELLVDALQPPCCSSAPPGGRLRGHFVRFVKGVDDPTADLSGHAVEVELRVLRPASAGAGADLPRLRVRRRDAQRRPGVDEEDGVYANADRGQVLFRSGLPALFAGAAEEQRGTLANGFWLEAIVESERPLNYTLRFGGLAAYGGPPPAAGASAWLAVNAFETVRLNATTPRGQLFEFDLGHAPAAQLRVQRCSGAGRLSIPSAGLAHPWVADDGRGRWELTLPGGQRAVDVGHHEVFVERLASADGAGAAFDIQLVSAGGLGLALPDPPLLSVPATSDGLALGAAAPAGLPSPPRGARLRYMAVSLPSPGGARNFTSGRPNANTSCGLRAAISEGVALTGAPVEVRLGSPLGAPLLVPLSRDLIKAKTLQTLNANSTVATAVLVELVGADGATLAASSYPALELSAVQAVALARASSGAARGVLGALLVAMAVGIAWVLLSRSGFCPGLCDVSRADVPDAFAGQIAGKRGAAHDEVELEVQYDLHSEERRFDAGAAPRYGYVPPSV